MVVSLELGSLLVVGFSDLLGTWQIETEDQFSLECGHSSGIA
ncbi:hypothetical protein PI124_g8034 [Phytophthora idaei]|nr:hypothetical protein PI125_g20537 [Phytophthora idaei]KAG3134080.1 hypothetical protein PI126_g18861 [Phytophthora idaei]KAG3247249.1 hypothetical protein PI124_g8034 [Phytophthora idaei]